MVGVEELVGAVIGPPKEQIRVEGAKLAEIDVGIRGDLDDLEQARRQAQRKACWGGCASAWPLTGWSRVHGDLRGL